METIFGILMFLVALAFCAVLIRGISNGFTKLVNTMLVALTVLLSLIVIFPGLAYTPKTTPQGTVKANPRYDKKFDIELNPPSKSNWENTVLSNKNSLSNAQKEFLKQ